MNINLSLPTSWNRCTLPQLRAIAEVLQDCAMRSDKYHPFDMLEVKVGVFFALTNLEIVQGLNPVAAVEDQYYTVRIRTPKFSIFNYQFSTKSEPFALYLWQIHSWLSTRKNPVNGATIPGMLDWLSPESKDNLLLFPFERISRRRRYRLRSVTFEGPSPLMDGFTWKRFRFAQDYMEMYSNQSNHLLQMQQLGKKVLPRDLLKAYKAVDLAKAMFLATIFCRKIAFVDETTGKTKRDFRYQSNQHSDNAQYFRNFPDRDWQIVTLWWQGMMHYLAKTYPKVFKMQPVAKDKKKKRVNPLELYTRTTATLEKYLHATASDIDREPYTTILQQLEDITRRNEETEKLNAKLKSRKKG